MKMQFIIFFIGVSSVLVKVEGDVKKEEPINIISSENANQDSDGALYRINLSRDDRRRNLGISDSFELRKKNCGKTKQACKDAGGQCQSKEKECDGDMLEGKTYCSKSKKCSCCVPREEPHHNRTTIAPYFQKYGIPFQSRGAERQIIRPIPCVCGLFLGIFLPAECKDHFNDGEPGCLKADDQPIACITDPCNLEPTHFIPHHVCVHCFTKEHAEEWCNGNSNLKGSLNTVFGTDFTTGKFDWGLSQSGLLQQVCMIPEYVPTWFCRKEKKVWQCEDHQFCTGGGSIETILPWETIGHFIPNTFQCLLEANP